MLKYEPPEFATQVHFGNVDGMELLNPSLSPEHRLLSLQGPFASTPTLYWLSSVTYLGHEIEPGTWLVTCSEDNPDRPAHLAVVQSIFHVDDVAYLHVWSINTPMHQGKDGVKYAKESDLASETAGELENIKLEGKRGLTVLLSTLFGGKRRFVEVP